MSPFLDVVVRDAQEKPRHGNRGGARFGHGDMSHASAALEKTLLLFYLCRSLALEWGIARGGGGGRLEFLRRGACT